MIQVGDTRRVAQADGRGFSKLGMEESEANLRKYFQQATPEQHQHGRPSPKGSVENGKRAHNKFTKNEWNNIRTQFPSIRNERSVSNLSLSFNHVACPVYSLGSSRNDSGGAVQKPGRVQRQRHLLWHRPCFDGFVGARCAVKVGEVSQRSVETACDPSITCNGHGACSGPADAASCVCAPGYFGARCQIPMRNVLVRRALESRQLAAAPCDADVACNGNGACSGTINDSSCICNAGFIGARYAFSSKKTREPSNKERVDKKRQIEKIVCDSFSEVEIAESPHLASANNIMCKLRQLFAFLKHFFRAEKQEKVTLLRKASKKIKRTFSLGKPRPDDVDSYSHRETVVHRQKEALKMENELTINSPRMSGITFEPSSHRMPCAKQIVSKLKRFFRQEKDEETKLVKQRTPTVQMVKEPIPEDIQLRSYREAWQYQRDLVFQIFFILPLNQTDMPKIIDFVVIKMKRLISEDKSEEEDVPEKNPTTLVRAASRKAGSKESHCAIDIGIFAMHISLPVIILVLVVPTHEFPITEGPCGAHQRCNNHGVCTQFPEGLFCLCDAEWVGVRCQIAREKFLNGTADEPCENFMDCNDHGFCSGHGKNLQCNCFDGWFGVRCQIPMDRIGSVALMILALITPTLEHPVGPV
ncbi:hypothetical protein PRIPAC_72420 [Pristionchus pacificus]|uniref:Uncharacterized protein n=1 Tax=Pristionchus pacificus TaxID=54126 RepID=A0A2A6C6B0_PRIPA|nr:hypothetical protein PRIPAC_72420 [Pristionchus pacificus]|eukprot:PDM73618.1 hypothetical protein PRIPAC_40974 [Pristionchus pacificus]